MELTKGGSEMMSFVWVMCVFFGGMACGYLLTDNKED